MIIGAILGLLGSILPEGIKLFQDYQDKNHELKLMQLQKELQKEGHQQRLQEVVVNAEVQQQVKVYDHDISLDSGYKWIDALRSSVRPVLAYAFFGLYAFVKIATVLHFYNNGVQLIDVIDLLWTAIDAEIFAAVVTFYFGRREIAKRLGGT